MMIRHMTVGAQPCKSGHSHRQERCNARLNNIPIRQQYICHDDLFLSSFGSTFSSRFEFIEWTDTAVRSTLALPRVSPGTMLISIGMTFAGRACCDLWLLCDL
jgi:hypothetical protein